MCFVIRKLYFLHLFCFLIYTDLLYVKFLECRRLLGVFHVSWFRYSQYPNGNDRRVEMAMYKCAICRSYQRYFLYSHEIQVNLRGLKGIAKSLFKRTGFVLLAVRCLHYRSFNTKAIVRDQTGEYTPK